VFLIALWLELNDISKTKRFTCCSFLKFLYYYQGAAGRKTPFIHLTSASCHMDFFLLKLAVGIKLVRQTQDGGTIFFPSAASSFCMSVEI